MTHLADAVPGLGLLRSKASPNAVHHDGEHLAGGMKGDSDARAAIVDDIVSCIRNPATTKPVIWLKGAAGTGKSAIAHLVAEKCREEGLLAATFVFWDADPSRNDLEHFVPTVADQMATTFPTIGEQINRVISQGPLIFTKAVRTQWEQLVIGAAHTHPPQRRAVIIIDGLDGCKNRTPGAVDLHTHQRQLLGLVWLAGQIPTFPFHFLITSRAEPAIVNIMNSPKFKPLLQSPITLGYIPESQEGIQAVATRNLRERGEGYAHVLSPERAHNRLRELVDWMVREARGESIFITTIFRDIDQVGGDP